MFFIYSIISIWLLLLYNVLLSFSGYIYYFKLESIRRDRMKKVREKTDWPMVSLLIPAHNESLVIRKTVESMLKLDYPNEKLEIIVINDNSSDDTGKILEEMQNQYKDRDLKVVTTYPPDGGKGKSNALNNGVKASRGDFIAVYDADNTPNSMALKYLAYEMLNNDEYAAVLGKFRVINKDKNMLTRFINTETLSFQWLSQGGRWNLFKLATIPGTNFIIRREIVRKLGGWDINAISEDTEVSIRIYKMGYKICFMPLAITYEQEPETLKVWLKQRQRWVKGNLYVIQKYFKSIFKFNKLSLDIVYFFSTYFIFLSSVIISDAIFILNLTGIIFNIDSLRLSIAGYFTTIWVLGYVLFIVQITIVLNLEKGEGNFKNLLYTMLMYFTYSQLWIIIAVKGMFSYINDRIHDKGFEWDKTDRF